MEQRQISHQSSPFVKKLVLADGLVSHQKPRHSIGVRIAYILFLYVGRRGWEWIGIRRHGWDRVGRKWAGRRIGHRPRWCWWQGRGWWVRHGSRRCRRKWVRGRNRWINWAWFYGRIERRFGLQRWDWRIRIINIGHRILPPRLSHTHI
jgi:hypothetical protein